MLNLPTKFILLDAEFTAWVGSLQRNWSGPNEYPELVQVGAVKVDNATLEETDHFECLVKPEINPVLSEFFTGLTGITQDDVEKRGLAFGEAIAKLADWCSTIPIYSFSYFDRDALRRNCSLLGIDFPLDPEQFHNIREFFKTHGIAEEKYHSSTITEAFGAVSTRRAHNALEDVRNILDGLKLLDKKLSQ